MTKRAWIAVIVILAIMIAVYLILFQEDTLESDEGLFEDDAIIIDYSKGPVEGNWYYYTTNEDGDWILYNEEKGLFENHNASLVDVSELS